jgi:hypothetical protein
MKLIVLFMQITFLTMIVKEQYEADNFDYIFDIANYTYNVLDINIWIYIKEYAYEKISVALWCL